MSTDKLKNSSWFTCTEYQKNILQFKITNKSTLLFNSNIIQDAKIKQPKTNTTYIKQNETINNTLI